MIYGAVRQHFREIEEICGVSGSQLWILHEVANSPGIGISGVADRLSIHQSTCSQLVEKLVARGLLTKERDRADQRRVGLVVMETTNELLTNAPGPVEGVLAGALNALPGDKLFALDFLLEEVVNRLSIRDDKFSDKPLADL
jgi:DNA-binding MarR family transcriptional regulator